MLLWMALTPALAQVTNGEIPEINAQTFRPTIDGDGLLWVDDAGRRRGSLAGGRLLLQYVDDPLVYVDTNDVETSLVSSVLQLDLMGGLNLGPVRLGLDLPVYLRSESAVVGGESGIGDLAGDIKLTLLDKPDGPIDVALSSRLWVPTSSVQTALGNRELAWEVAALLSREFGPLLVALNVGTRGGPEEDLENIRLNDGFIARLGLGLDLSPRSGIAVEGATTLPYTAPLSNPAASPIELMGSGYVYPGKRSPLVLRAGAGAGLTPGIGSPDFRVVIGMGIEPRGETDRDGDGYPDSQDGCPDEPEDFDKFQDEDGCPDPDNDDDGILDVDDSCPNVPEDIDEFEDRDGCPEPTVVTIKVVDKETDEPVNLARVTMADDEGGNGRLTPFRRRIPEGEYKAAVTRAGYVPADVTVEVPPGPPIERIIELERDETSQIVNVTDKKIEFRDTVLFETNKAVIKKESYNMLDEGVKLMRNYPEIKVLRIQGHTDERGSATYNQTLSEQRAASVRQYFIDAKVDPARLESEGFGETRPVDPRSVPEAWDKNRRVDFWIELEDDDDGADEE